MKKRIISVLMVIWICATLTLIYPVTEVQAALSPVMAGEALVNTVDKVIGSGVLSRAGMRVGSASALAKASAVWGCRAAVTSGLSGAAVAGAAVVGTGAAVAVGGATLPAWLPVVLAVGSVASLVSTTTAIISDMKSLGANDVVLVGEFRVPDVFDLNGYTPRVSILSGIIAPDGTRAYWRWNDTDYSPTVITSEGSKIDYQYKLNKELINSKTWCFSGNPTTLNIHTFDENGNLDIYFGNFPRGTDCESTVYNQSLIDISGNEFVNSDISFAPNVPVGDSENIIINMPNLDMIRETNPSWTEDQVEEEALNMILANPEYVIAENEFGEPEVPPIEEPDSVIEYLQQLLNYFNPNSDQFLLKKAFIPTKDLGVTITNIKNAALDRLPFAWVNMWASAGAQSYTNEEFRFWWRVGLFDPEQKVGFTVAETTGFRDLSTIIILVAAVWAGYGEVRRFIG